MEKIELLNRKLELATQKMKIAQNWNYKNYVSDEAALEALVQLRNSGSRLHSDEFRLVPVYVLPKSEIRKITISKIIKKEEKL